MVFLWPEFWTASLLMGAGIGIDAALATGMQGSRFSRRSQALAWIAGITLTHTVFPLAGYSLSYLGLLQLPVLSPLVGLLAFVLIGSFLLSEWRRPAGHEGNGSSALAGIGLLLAVSWDALWSGPAKSAQVVDWPPLAVWASFVVVGAVVALLCWLAWCLADHVSQLADNALLQCCQYSIIGYFGWLALCRYTFALDIHWPWLLLFSLLLTALAMAIMAAPAGRVGQDWR